MGNESLVFEQAGIIELPKGTADVRVMRIESSPVLDVLVLTKNVNFKEEDLTPLQFNDEAKLLKEYKIPSLASAVRFGDVNGDGKKLFRYKFKMTEEGKGNLFFGGPVYHMSDYIGSGA